MGMETMPNTPQSMLHLAIAEPGEPNPTHYLCGTPISVIEAVADREKAPRPDCVVCADLESTADLDLSL